MKPVFIILLVIFSAQVQASQKVDEKGLSQCKSIVQDKERLACFDELVPSMSKSAKPETSIKQQGKWEIREKTNPVSNTKQVLLLLDADFGQSSTGENISMVVRCRADLTDMYIIWGDSLDTEKVSVIVKLGNKNVETELWERSRSFKTSFRDRPTHLLRQMMLYEKAVFQVKIDRNPVTAVFDISGLRKVLRPVRELCNWTH